MRRVVVLALLALALPMIATAGTINITNQFGTLAINSAGITSKGSQLWSFNGISTGHAMGIVNFNTGVCLSGCNGSGIPGSLATFSSAGSSFTVVCHQAACGGNNTVLFSGSFVGNITVTMTSPPGAKTVTYTLSGNIAGMFGGHFVTGSTTQMLYSTGAQWSQGIGHIHAGSTGINTPEPGTLGLLGTGLIGIAGMFRRKILGQP